MNLFKPGSRSRRIARWVAIGGLVFAVVTGTVLAVVLRPASLKAAAEEKLSERLGLDVTIATLSVSLLPHPTVSGTNLVFRVPENPNLPPFIEIPEFTADAGFFGLASGHVSTVRLRGMKITVPPVDQREGLDVTSGAGGTDEIVVDHLEADGAVLTLLRRTPDRAPLVFNINALSVRDVGFGREMPFSAELTNPVPAGLVRSEGRIGPWIKGRPTAFPMSGDYTFTSADLGTIRGISGTLTSEGKYAGRLSEIIVTGTTDTPDFNLDLGGKPVPLKTTFKAIVNASNGTTMLERVDATLFNTAVVVSGLVENLPGPAGNDITLEVAVEDGRIEDILRLLTDSDQPFLTGDVFLKSQVALSPGEGSVRDRLVLDGRFGLASGQFTDSAVQVKLMELSRRSQGKDNDERMSRVVTALSGDFRLSKGALRLTGLRFRVPGAMVSLNGTYRLTNAELDFTGTLRMQASVSEAVGGFKSIFIKPFDALFRRDGAGAVVPIRISGHRDAPKMGVRFGSVFGGDKP